MSDQEQPLGNPASSETEPTEPHADSQADQLSTGARPKVNIAHTEPGRPQRGKKLSEKAMQNYTQEKEAYCARIEKH